MFSNKKKTHNNLELTNASIKTGHSRPKFSDQIDRVCNTRKITQHPNVDQKGYKHVCLRKIYEHLNGRHIPLVSKQANQITNYPNVISKYWLFDLKTNTTAAATEKNRSCKKQQRSRGSGSESESKKSVYTRRVTQL